MKHSETRIGGLYNGKHLPSGKAIKVYPSSTKDGYVDWDNPDTFYPKNDVELIEEIKD